MNQFLKRFVAIFVLVAMLSAIFAVAAMAEDTLDFVTTGKCYMRKAPNKESKKIQTIEKGKTLKTTKWEKDTRGVKWYYGTCNGKKGWVSSKNLHAKESPLPKPTPKPTKKPSKEPSYKKYVKITGSCNIRKSADLDSKKLGTASKGEYYKCSGAKYDDRGVAWYKISYKDGHAWVSSKFSKPVSSKPTAPKATAKPAVFNPAGYYVCVTASTLNMRSAPDTDSVIIKVYVTGDILRADQTNGAWMLVTDEATGNSGFMSAKYLQQCAAPQAVAFEAEPEVEEPAIVEPTADSVAIKRQKNLDMENVLSNMKLRVEVSSNNIAADSVIADVFDVVSYDIVDVALMKVGDTIETENGDVLVKTIDREGSVVVINGGYFDGGIDLYPSDEDNCYYSISYEVPVTVMIGQAQFGYADSVTFNTYVENADGSIGEGYDTVVVSGAEAGAKLAELVEKHYGTIYASSTSFTIGSEQQVITEVTYDYVP